MKKTILSASVAALLAASAMSAMAEEAASPLSFNVGVTTDYLFRGVTQTHHDAALQGGVDYAFSNGFYIGAWGSTISWVKDWLGKGSTEVDLYGGYRGAFADPDWTYDLGLITYNYPSKGSASPGNLANPNTTEVYASVGYKWISAKYSYATSSHFVGWYAPDAAGNFTRDTRGSDYLEVNANYDLGDGWGVNGHVGHQKVANFSAANYSDWKVGVTKDVGFGVIGLSYSDTSAKGDSGQPYYWGKNGTSTTAPSGSFTNVAKGVAALSFTKTF